MTPTDLPFFVTEELLIAIKEAIASNNSERIPYPYESESTSTVSITLDLETAQALKGLTQNPLENTWMSLSGIDRRSIFDACVKAGV